LACEIKKRNNVTAVKQTAFREPNKEDDSEVKHIASGKVLQAAK